MPYSARRCISPVRMCSSRGNRGFHVRIGNDCAQSRRQSYLQCHTQQGGASPQCACAAPGETEACAWRWSPVAALSCASSAQHSASAPTTCIQSEASVCYSQPACCLHQCNSNSTRHCCIELVARWNVIYVWTHNKSEEFCIQCCQNKAVVFTANHTVSKRQADCMLQRQCRGVHTRSHTTQAQSSLYKP